MIAPFEARRAERKTLSKVWEFLELGSIESPEIARERTNTYDDRLNERTRARLAAHYRPHNERLYELIGEDFNW